MIEALHCKQYTMHNALYRIALHHYMLCSIWCSTLQIALIYLLGTAAIGIFLLDSNVAMQSTRIHRSHPALKLLSQMCWSTNALKCCTTLVCHLHDPTQECPQLGTQKHSITWFALQPSTIPHSNALIRH